SVKDGVIARFDNDVEIACWPAAQASISLASDANTLAVSSAHLDTDLEWLRSLGTSLSMASRTSRDVFASPMAPWTLHLDLHTPTGLLDCPFALALRTGARGLDESGSRTSRAGFSPPDIQTHPPATDCRPKWHVDLVFKVRTRLWPFLGGGSSPIEHAGENV